MEIIAVNMPLEEKDERLLQIEELINAKRKMLDEKQKKLKLSRLHVFVRPESPIREDETKCVCFKRELCEAVGTFADRISIHRTRNAFYDVKNHKRVRRDLHFCLRNWKCKRPKRNDRSWTEQSRSQHESN